MSSSPLASQEQSAALGPSAEPALALPGRWAVCAMLFFATSINYMDRQVLGILGNTLQHSIGWTELQYSYIIMAFQVAYAAGLLLAGRFIDRVGTRLGYAVTMAVWSLAAMAHALASSALAFGVARFFLGLGESGNFPAAIKATAEWFPQRERSLATGIFNSGANVGAILGPALVPLVATRFGWRPAFLITGAFSACWIAWWLLHYRTPRPAANAAALPGAVAPLPRGALSWARLLHFRQTWAFALAKFLTDPIWWFYLYWLPKFLEGRFHLDLHHLGLPLIVVYNVSMLGSVGGGSLPLLLMRRGVAPGSARLRSMLLMALLVTPIFFAGRTENVWVAVALLSLAAAAHQGWSANLLTIASDLFPSAAVGTVTGIGGMAGSVGGLLFAAAVGWVLTRFHVYSALFIMCSGAYLLALGIFRALVPRLARVDGLLLPAAGARGQ